MLSKNYQKIVKKNKYNVFLFVCHATIPFGFAVHPWFVVVKKDKISRWEVFFQKNMCKTSLGHLHLNALPPFKGIEALPFCQLFYWKAGLIGHIGGGGGSAAKKMADFEGRSKSNYPYSHTYSILGPNSNTYVQWVLDNFPESKLKLPWNSFGKYHRTKK